MELVTERKSHPTDIAIRHQRIEKAAAVGADL